MRLDRIDKHYTGRVTVTLTFGRPGVITRAVVDMHPPP